MRMISCLALSLFMMLIAVPQANANPCPYRSACIELELERNGNQPWSTPWSDRCDAMTGLCRDRGVFASDRVMINGTRKRMFAYQFTSRYLREVAAVNPETEFSEGTNTIDLHSENLGGAAGIIARVKYWSQNAAQARVLCEGRYASAQSHVSCSNVRLDLRLIDPQLAAQIGAIQAETRAHRARANQPTQEELQANNDERNFEREKNELDRQIAALNAELNAIHFEDFDTINVDQMVQLIGEDATIGEAYQRLKQNVDQVRESIQHEVHLNHERTQQTEAGLARVFGETCPAPVEFVQPGPEAAEAPPFQREEYGPMPAAHAQGSVHEISRQVISNLESALRRGDQAEFLAIYTQWRSYQSHVKAAMDRGGRSKGAALEELRQGQSRILKYVHRHVDLYGFFRAAQIPEVTKRIIGEQIKLWNEGYSRDLIEELNTWQGELSPVQQRIVAAIGELGRVLERLNDPRSKEGEGDPVRDEARHVMNAALETGAEKLIEAARLSHASVEAGEGSAATSHDLREEVGSEAQEALEESQSGLKIALAIGDFLVGLSPLGSAKDLLDAFRGVNLLTGETLSFNERVFSFTTGVLGLATLGASNVVNTSIKGAVAVGKRARITKTLARTAARVERIEEVALKVERIVDSAGHGLVKLEQASIKTPQGLNNFSKNPLKEVKYTNRVEGQVKRGDFHGFPDEVDNFAGLGKRSTITGGDGIPRTKIELEGGYMNRDGHFEWIIEPDGVTVNHRLFVPKK